MPETDGTYALFLDFDGTLVDIVERPDAVVVAPGLPEILTRLEEQSRQHYVRSEIMAPGYAAVGDMDRAFACLERAFQVRSAGLIYLHVDPAYHSLRGDPRFGSLVERIGLR